MNYNIVTVSGDGIGPDVIGEAVKVLNVVGEKFGHKFNFTEKAAGGRRRRKGRSRLCPHPCNLPANRVNCL